MRKRLALATKKVRTGDLVRISLYLKDGYEKVLVSAWSKEPDDEHFGPHVPRYMLATFEEDKPKLITPPGKWNLSAQNRSREIEFIADCDMQYRLQQETDLSDKAVVKARIKRYGKIAQAIRRFYRNTFGPHRN